MRTPQQSTLRSTTIRGKEKPGPLKICCQLILPTNPATFFFQGQTQAYEFHLHLIQGHAANLITRQVNYGEIESSEFLHDKTHRHNYQHKSWCVSLDNCAMKLATKSGLTRNKIGSQLDAPTWQHWESARKDCLWLSCPTVTDGHQVWDILGRLKNSTSLKGTDFVVVFNM